MNDERKPDDAENGLPDSVRSALKNRYGPVPGVPSEIDHAILADARRHFEAHGPAALRPSRRRRVSGWQWTAIASTVAAASVMMMVWRTEQPQQRMNDSMVATAPASANGTVDSDLDHSGRVDMLDAFAMARLIRDGGSGAPDLNRDGRFDQQDIDLVARKAVLL
ncbi:MAG: hypothetical protein H7Z17_21410 [Fuerstia sp.]|nr:hypothetical protein [Fuerstiella sp.]